MVRRFSFLVVGIALFVGLVFLRVASQRTSDVRSRAANTTAVVVPTAIPAPKTLLTIPYLRLVTSKKSAKVGEMVPVDVLINSDGKSVVEAQAVLQYDPEVFSLPQDAVQQSTLLPTMNVNSVAHGSVDVSFFVTQEAGYQPVFAQTEHKVATFFFKVIGTKGATSEILLLPNHAGGSSIMTPVSAEERRTENVLQSVEGVTVEIK